MHILFTGASSFTGFWFVKELIEQGHQVIACLRSSFNRYEGLRLQRLNQLADRCQLVFDTPFGSENFFKVIGQQAQWDLFCHHAADVTNYKSPEFNPVTALASNAFNLKRVLEQLQLKSCHKVLLTGSVFEQQEGQGEEERGEGNEQAVSAYGLSKGLTTQVFHFYTHFLQLKLGKFVIPNPFGPLEEVRYTSYLIQQWYQNQVPVVQTPDYVRDNIPVSLLAKAYVAFAQQLTAQKGFQKINPSCYCESQACFTKRFAQAMRKRLNLTCQYELKVQQEFAEPRKRVNTDVLDHLKLQWQEKEAWDELALYYKEMYGKK